MKIIVYLVLCLIVPVLWGLAVERVFRSIRKKRPLRSADLFFRHGEGI